MLAPNIPEYMQESIKNVVSKQKGLLKKPIPSPSGVFYLLYKVEYGKFSNIVLSKENS